MIGWDGLMTWRLLWIISGDWWKASSEANDITGGNFGWI